jgi:hypothetical protein
MSLMDINDINLQPFDYKTIINSFDENSTVFIFKKGELNTTFSISRSIEFYMDVCTDQDLYAVYKDKKMNVFYANTLTIEEANRLVKYLIIYR